MNDDDQEQPGQIVTVWQEGSGEPPEGTPAGVIEVQQCTACRERRVIWGNDTSGLDPWKKHYDYCEPLSFEEWSQGGAA